MHCLFVFPFFLKYLTNTEYSIWSVVDLLRRNPHWWSPIISFEISGVKLNKVNMPNLNCTDAVFRSPMDQSSASCPSVGLPPHNPRSRLATLFTGVFVVITTWQGRSGLIASSRRRVMQEHYSRQNGGGLADLHSPNVYASLFRDVSVALSTSACVITYLLTYLLTHSLHGAESFLRS